MDSAREQAREPWSQRCFSFIQDFVNKRPKLVNKRVFRLFTGIQFLLTIFITGTPFWTAEFYWDTFTFMGLWSICHPKSCDKIKVSDDTINTMRICTLTALGCSLIIVLGSWNVLIHVVRKKMVENSVCAVLSFVSGISLSAAAGVLCVHIEEELFLNFYLAILLSILAVFLGIVNVLNIFYGIFTNTQPTGPANTVEDTQA